MTEKHDNLVMVDSNELKHKDLSTSGHSTKMARLKFLVGLNGDIVEADTRHDNSFELKSNEKINAECVVVNDDEVLYQNNVEAALNSLSKICANGGPLTSNCPDTGNNHDEDDGRSEKIRRRHSSSVEITAMTSVKTGADGVPVISFSFLQTDDEEKCMQSTKRDNTIDNKESRVALELYDFPKNSRPTSIYNQQDLMGVGGINVVVKDTATVDSTNSVNEVVIDLQQDNLYDFPKSRPLPACPNSSQVAQTSDVTLNECLYDIPQSKNDELKIKRDNLSKQKHSFTSLTLDTSLDEAAKSAQRDAYSDSECPEEHHHQQQQQYEKRRKHKFGKAWGKMRVWLREEKVKLSEVVQRHAKMQAVGATGLRGNNNSGVTSEESSPSGSRCGSYDLVAARARELGTLTHVEEYGLASVSEEIHDNCSDVVLSHDPKTRNNTVKCRSDDDDDDDDNVDVKVQMMDKKSTENSITTHGGGLRKKRIAGSEGNLSGMKLKLTPVSFSLDKLCDDDGNDDVDDEKEKDNLKPTTNGRELKAHVQGKGGLIKRRMLGSIRGLMASTHLLQQHDTDETGPGGFEDIRRYVKQGGDFCKELAAILHERAELEASYAKGLSKLSGKLTKACSKDQGGNSSGGVNEAWRSVGEEMEAAAEAHRVWGLALGEQLAKPLRVGVAEAQGRSRKAIESSVDKASKSLQEWRGVAAKSKKQSFACARENERLQDLARIQSISQSQQNNNKTSSHHMTEKEVNKLENRRRKAEDSSRRADTEFYTVSVRAERARLEYESTVRKGAKQMELLEEERLSALKDLANVYLSHLQALAPRLQQSADRLATPVRSCSVSQDIDVLKNLIRRMDSNDAATVDQLLPDFYAEHVTLAMNRERRKQSLVRVLHLIRQDLDRERRGREGLETLHRAFIQTPAFAADESTQNVTDKLHHMRSMLTYLEAARYKVGGALAEVEGGKKAKHPLAEHILVSRDKQGLQQSVLKMPVWAKNESFEFPEVEVADLEIHLTKEHETERHEWIDRTAGDGNSENPPDEEDFSDFDEFSSQSEDNNNQDVDGADSIVDKSERIEQCRAIYQYSANLNDELSLTPGDLITIHRKQADGWWIGECGGRTGIFPATYVQVIH